MEKVIFKPSYLSGEVSALPSKSDIHRSLICALLARGKSTISPVVYSQDVKATVLCCRAAGAKVICEENSITIDSGNAFDFSETENGESIIFDCKESGSTLRFFIPVLCSAGVNASYKGSGRLPQRPLDVYKKVFERRNIFFQENACDENDGVFLSVRGKLTGGEFYVEGNISSQFITGLLLALPTVKEDSKIIITTPLESEPYVNMTLDVMKSFGVEVQRTDYGYFIHGNQKYIPCCHTVQGDWSQAAFFLCAGALNGDVTVKGLDINSRQGDKKAVDILREFGCEIKVNESEKSVTANSKNKLSATLIDGTDIPDLMPVLACVAAFASGTTKIINIGRLRYKESDRLAAVAKDLKALGCHVLQHDDSLEIHGANSQAGGECDGFNDHRMVMAMSAAALRCQKEVSVTTPFAINKSYPDYFEEYKKLGGKADVIDVG